MKPERSEIAIRPGVPGDEEALAKVHVAAWQTAYRGILPDAFLDGLDVQARVARWRERLTAPGEREFSLVAETSTGSLGRTIIGFAGGGPQREGFADSDGVPYDGEVYAIYLLAEWRRQGVGRRLMEAAVKELIGSGHQAVVIWVLRDNANGRRFYESLDGVLVGRKSITIGPSAVIEVAYGWRDARQLLAAAAR